jgi:hypothetical protein
MNLKDIFLKGLEFALGAHGILHIFEFGVAIYEEAYITASIAAFGAITMLLGSYFLGHHHHHQHPHVENH